MNHLGHAGLLKRVIGGHWGLVQAYQHGNLNVSKFGPRMGRGRPGRG